MITHGPQVRAGPSGGVSGSRGFGPTYENGDDPGPFLFGALLASGAYGWRPARSTLPGIRIGVQVPVVPSPREFATDVYVQAPRAWLGPLAGGVGVLTAHGAARTMPYAQLGVERAGGAGVHLVAGRYAYRWGGIGYSVAERATVGWLSAQIPTSSRMTTHVHAGIGHGHVRKVNTNDGVPYVDEDRYVGLGGFTFELHRARP